jgi:hypothetical protein
MLASLFHFGMAPAGALAMFQSTSSNTFLMSVWSTATQNLSSSTMTTTLTGLGYTILSVVLIGGVYGVFARGGDLRELIMLMVKVAICGLLIAQWNTFFLTDITTSGVFAIATSINQTDVFSALGTSLFQNLQNDFSTLSGIVTTIASGGDLEIIQLIFTVLACVCYAVAYGILAVVFSLWGTILYAMGPVLIATIPSGYFGNMGKTYVKALIEWLSWPILFAIISELMAQLNLTNTTGSTTGSSQPLWQHSPLSAQSGDLLIAITTIVFSIMLLGLPWMAHKLLNGDFAGSMGGAITTAAAAATGAVMGGAGMLGGSASASAGAGGAGSSSGAGAGAAGAGAGAGSGATPPPPSPAGGSGPTATTASGGGGGSATPPPPSPPGGFGPTAATAGSGGGGATPSSSSPFSGSDGSTVGDPVAANEAASNADTRKPMPPRPSASASSSGSYHGSGPGGSDGGGAEVPSADSAQVGGAEELPSSDGHAVGQAAPAPGGSSSNSGSGGSSSSGSNGGSSSGGGSGSGGSGGWSNKGALAGAMKGAFGGFGAVANAASRDMLKAPPETPPSEAEEYASMQQQHGMREAVKAGKSYDEYKGGSPSESEAYDMAFKD